MKIRFEVERPTLDKQSFLIFALGFVWSSNTGGTTVLRIAVMNITFHIRFIHDDEVKS